ncbi:MAG: polysaccharide biosynthesis tyrosine autokinase [Syntrophobacteraceae bacterium]|jgi:capsular exopolysaccharide synthesis family protein
MSGDLEKLDLECVPPRISGDNFQPPARCANEPTRAFDDSADIRDYLEIIIRRKWQILTVLMVSVVTALIISLTLSPLYKATGKIELTVQSPRVTKFEDMMILGSQVQTREFMQTHLKLLRSESLADRVIDKLHLENNPAFNPPKGQKPGILNFLPSIKDQLVGFFSSIIWGAERPADPKLLEARLRGSLETKFDRGLDVQSERDTTIFSLAFASADPSLSRNVINALIEEFISWQVDKKVDASIAAKQRLGKQIELGRVQLEKAETNLNDFSRKAGIVSLNANLNLIYSQLEEANKAYSTIQAERISKEALYKQSLEAEGSFPAMLENPLIQKLRGDCITVASQYKEAGATFKDDYPTLQNLKAKLTDIEKQIKNEESRILKSIRNDYLGALRKEEELKKDTEEKKVLAMELNDRATQYKILEREVETSKQIHQSLLERSKEIDAKVGTELGNIQVVDYAKLPLKPYSPNIPRNLLFSVLAGMVCGIGLAFLLEYLDNTIKRIDEISDRFQLPVLGVLPLVQGDESQSIGSLVRTKPKACFSESIRTAKISIQLSSSLDRPPKLLLITSTVAGEGKSTIAVNLAQAFAPEEKVLIIDADLRRPTLHKVLSTNGAALEKNQGLSNYLTGMTDEIVQETGIPNLKVIYSGPVPPNPSELLSSNRMRQFLAGIYDRYDRIIVDGPMATGFADALILGHYADGVILVSTLGQTHREALRILRRNIENVGGRMIGAIVNKLNLTNQYGGYYYKYYRYYSYHTGYRQEKAPDALAGQ